MRTKRIVRLWERMSALYGSRWAFEYGPGMDASGNLAPLASIWADALEDADNSAIAAGLRKCLDRDRDAPPTLPEFLRLCGARTGHGSRDTRPPAMPALPPYADTPRQRMERLAEKLAAEARDSGAEDSRAYWITKIGATLVGKSLVKAWKGSA